MGVKLTIQPRRSAFLCAYAQEIGASLSGREASLFCLVAVAVAGFKWPEPGHAVLFPVLLVNSK